MFFRVAAFFMMSAMLLLSSPAAALDGAQRDCLVLAGSSLDPGLPDGLAGVALYEIEVDKALSACEQATAAIGENAADAASLWFSYGRALHAAERFDEAMDWYDRAVKAGLPLARINRGVIMLTGTQTLDANPYWTSLQFEMACDEGVVLGCRNAADLYSGRSTYRRDEARMAEFYTRGCALDDARSCFFLGSANLDGLGVDRDATESFRLFSRACELGDGEACNMLGRLTFEGIGTQKDAAAGLQFVEQSCALGFGLGCFNAGVAVAKGVGTAPDASRGIELLLTGCKIGSGHACTELAYVYENGLAGVTDMQAALNGYELACAYGIPSSCSKAAAYYSEGEIVGTDPARALELFEAGCAGGMAEDCYTSAKRYERGTAVKKDFPRAFELFAAACDNGHAKACKELGRHYELGWAGIRANDILAVKYFDAGCSLEDAGSCTEAADTLLKSMSDRQIDRSAYALLAEACRLGPEHRCREAGTILSRHELPPSVWPEARPVVALACDQGLAVSCAQLGLHEALETHKATIDDMMVACDAGVAEGCLEAWDAIGDGEESEPELGQKVAQGVKNACERSNARACYLVGSSLSSFAGTNPDLGSAADDAFDKACKLGSMESCLRLAVSLLDGDHGDPDPDEAVRIYERMCALERRDNANAFYCAAAAAFRGQNAVGMRDQETAAQSAMRGCGLGAAQACLLSGYDFSEGKGVAQSPFMAEQYWKAGCRMGSVKACTQISRQAAIERNERDEGDTDDLDMKLVNFGARSCFFGSEDDCDFLKGLFEEDFSESHPEAYFLGLSPYSSINDFDDLPKMTRIQGDVAFLRLDEETAEYAPNMSLLDLPYFNPGKIIVFHFFQTAPGARPETWQYTAIEKLAGQLSQALKRPAIQVSVNLRNDRDRTLIKPLVSPYLADFEAIYTGAPVVQETPQIGISARKVDDGIIPFVAVFADAGSYGGGIRTLYAEKPVYDDRQGMLEEIVASYERLSGQELNWTD